MKNPAPKKLQGLAADLWDIAATPIQISREELASNRRAAEADEIITEGRRHETTTQRRERAND